MSKNLHNRICENIYEELYGRLCDDLYKYPKNYMHFDTLNDALNNKLNNASNNTSNDIYFIRSFLGSCHEYRMYDGSNNNKKNEEYGVTNGVFLNTGKIDYLDGISKPNDTTRPGAREISNLVFAENAPEFNSKCASNMFWLWGQFIDHDITRTEKTDESYDIMIPKGDQQFDPNSTGDKIIDFKRTTYKNEPRQQINLLTPFIDGSMVYGSDSARNSYLREFKGGRLKVSQGNMLPFTNGHILNEGNPGTNIYVAGDIRANEHVGLCALHTLFVREHNYWADLINKYYGKPHNQEKKKSNLCNCDKHRLCNKLCNCNYSHCDKKCNDRIYMDDEAIYQIAKMIVEAEIQAITFNEFLPLLLGSCDGIKKYCGYNENVNPQLLNEFSAASFRFGHSLLPTKVLESHTLRDTFFSPHLMANKLSMESILSDFSSHKCMNLDNKMSPDVRNFLFGKPGQGGLDLGALTIQRGRDHGLPDYNYVRQHYGLQKMENSNLYNVYHDHDIIDLFVGGLSESPYKDSMLGELFHKIIKDQFERIRDGDRLWYENRMTKKQIEHINNTKLSDIIKRNTCVKYLKDNVFIV